MAYFDMADEIWTLPEDLIYAYTRAQAVEDGEQILLEGKLADMAREAGWVIPVYLTSTVFSILERVRDNKRTASDFEGVLWDILYMGGLHARRNTGDTVKFNVYITGAGRQKRWLFIAEVGAVDIDNPAPCVTIMLPEDL
jgi:hypothetical protein